MTQENTPNASGDSAGQGEGCMFSGFMARMMERLCGGATCERMIAVLGISVANSRVVLHRGREALRGMFEKGCVLSFGDDAIPCERRPAPEGQ